MHNYAYLEVGFAEGNTGGGEPVVVEGIVIYLYEILKSVEILN